MLTVRPTKRSKVVVEFHFGELVTRNVFAKKRVVAAPTLALPEALKPNMRLKMDGLEFLSQLPHASVPVAFFDPQYRGVLDKMNYGNEGESREKRRCSLQQMNEAQIIAFVRSIDAVLMPSGHLFLWMDKFHLCQGFTHWLTETKLTAVDLIVWDKGRLGMGYRTRRTSEFCVVLQKKPKRAKGVWQTHTLPDVWRNEKKSNKEHPHQKPLALQTELIAAVSHEGDYVIDPAAGSFSVMAAARECKRNFIGCDLVG